MLNELIGFMVPEWTLEKMKIQMQSMRTDGPKIPKLHKPKETQTNTAGNKKVLLRKCKRHTDRCVASPGGAVDRQNHRRTDTCENITFPILRMRSVMNEFLLFQQEVKTFCVLCYVTQDSSNISTVTPLCYGNQVFHIR